MTTVYGPLRQSPISASTLTDFDADVVNVRRSIVVEKNGDLTDADAAIDGESLTPRRRSFIDRSHRLAQAHRAKTRREGENYVGYKILMVDSIFRLTVATRKWTNLKFDLTCCSFWAAAP